MPYFTDSAWDMGAAADVHVDVDICALSGQDQGLRRDRAKSKHREIFSNSRPLMVIRPALP